MALKEATNETAAAKIGLYGNAGSGKTRTAIEIALGLATTSGAPIAFFDTEGGSDFMVARCRKEGVKLLREKARSFDALMGFMAEARALGAVIIVDSITHTWADLRESYERKLRRTKGLEIWDWGKIKPEWHRFTAEFLTSPCHAIVCGRSASIYAQEWNEEKGKNEMNAVGTKMATEKETAYEPSLLIEMERAPRHRVQAEGIHVIATVVKDRSDNIDGQQFTDPTFETFRPFFDVLNIGGQHHPTDVTGNSDRLFSSPDNMIQRKRDVEVALEEIKEALVLGDVAGTGKEEKKRQTEVLRAAFGTSSWTAISDMKLEVLREGLTNLRRTLGLTEAGEPVTLTDDEAAELVRTFQRAAELGVITAEQSMEVVGRALAGDHAGLREEMQRVQAELDRAIIPQGPEKPTLSQYLAEAIVADEIERARITNQVPAWALEPRT